MCSVYSLCCRRLFRSLKLLMHVAILSGSSVYLSLVCNRVVILGSFANLFLVQYLYLDLFLDAKLLNIGVPFVVPERSRLLLVGCLVTDLNLQATALYIVILGGNFFFFNLLTCFFSHLMHAAHHRENLISFCCKRVNDVDFMRPV